jgi:hypothetical protein
VSLQGFLDNVIASLEQLASLITSLGIPEDILRAAPFLLPLVISLLSRRLFIVFVVIAISTYATLVPSVFFNGAGEAIVWFAPGYLGSFLVLMVLSIDSYVTASGRREVLRRLAEVEIELSVTKLGFDRERLWRRAGGAAEEPYLDAEIVALAERVLERRDVAVAIRSGTPPATRLRAQPTEQRTDLPVEQKAAPANA